LYKVQWFLKQNRLSAGGQALANAEFPHGLPAALNIMVEYLHALQERAGINLRQWFCPDFSGFAETKGQGIWLLKYR
jgi:hypothetical protein